ncbi:sensor histidine kinase [Chryseolinea soli]|nr:ATP-binding protein [Chryseolinea soli]
MNSNLQNISSTPNEPWFSHPLGKLNIPHEWLMSGERREKGFAGPDLKRSVPGRSRKLIPASKPFDYEHGEHRANRIGTDCLQEIQKIKEASEEDLCSTRQELSKALDELRRRNAAWIEAEKELCRTKILLEQYHFLSNHDLQEPLRKLQMFSDLLSGPQANLNDYAQKYSEKINAAAARMSLLLKDLSHFSLARKTDAENFETVDLNKVVNEVTSDLETVTRKKNATIHSSPLPVIQGDPAQIKQLFQNLLGNALTFNRGNAIIEISASKGTAYTFPNCTGLKTGTAYVCIRITDNGIGFDQKYATKIFTLFQRLREKKGLKGSGTGLSICKQIIENHDGLIYAYGRENEGATFTLFFPCNQKSSSSLASRL